MGTKGNGFSISKRDQETHWLLSLTQQIFTFTLNPRGGALNVKTRNHVSAF